MIYIMSWVIPLIVSIMVTTLLGISQWFFILPLVALTTFLFRLHLIDVYGIHTIITYKLRVLDKDRNEHGEEQDEL